MCIFKKSVSFVAIGLVCSAMMCGSVYGDVFLAQLGNGKNVTVVRGEDRPACYGQQGSFDTFLTQSMRSNDSPQRIQDPFTQTDIQWQMLGYAVFFPEGSNEPQQVYVAKKRKYRQGQALADNNPKTGGHVLNYSSNMHTERQLAIVALEEAIETLQVTGADYNDGAIGPLLPGAKVPLQLSAAQALSTDITGTLCIYTADSPCQTKLNDNNNFSCIEYYRALSQKFPNVALEVYAPKLDLNSEYVRSNTTLINKIKDEIVHYVAPADRLIGSSRTRGIKLKTDGSISFYDGPANIKEGDDITPEGNTPAFLNTLKKLLQDHPALRARIFNALHGTDKITFRLI